MEKEKIRKELEEKLESAQKILVGIGAEWKAETKEEKETVREAAETLKELLDGKDYYILSTLAGEDLAALPFEKTHMAAPFDVSCTEKDWDSYMLWLSCTLNRETIILELGEDFLNPNVMRWPFEKTAMINQKAYLYRIHKKFYQIPDELKEKATAVAYHSAAFFTQEEENGSN